MEELSANFFVNLHLFAYINLEKTFGQRDFWGLFLRPFLRSNFYKFWEITIMNFAYALFIEYVLN